MKQAENNEIDTLLRNLARRERTAQSGVGATAGEYAAQGAHLDSDELSSYAERALPPSARARCTAHLADCDDCRQIVAQLSLAAGPLLADDEIKAAVAGPTWKQKLSLFFAPRMIRYATPALVLLVIAVAFFVWRHQQTSKPQDFIALNEKREPASAVKPASAQPQAAAQPGETGAAPEVTKSQEQKEEKAETSSATPAASPTTEGEVRDEKKPASAATGSASAAKAGKEDAPAADKAAGPPAYAPESAPAPAKQQSSVAANQEQQPKDLAQNNADSIERGRDANVARKGPARGDNEVASQRGPAKREAQPVSKAKAADVSTASGRAERDEETRTVLGRHFRRVSNAWVDTAYSSSMSIRSVTRGTEAFRALVADEPAIESIGKQLSGEVIVVWKGRAYRIN